MKNSKLFFSLSFLIFFSIPVFTQVEYEVGNTYIVAKKGPIYDSPTGVIGRIVVVNIGDTLLCVEPLYEGYLKVQFNDVVGYFDYQRLRDYQNYVESINPDVESTNMSADPEQPEKPSYQQSAPSADQHDEKI